jgi:hypothetical protein
VIERIAQKQKCGCTVAAVAMVTGKSYEEVARASTRDFDNDGVQLEDWLEYLFENGFTFHRLYRVTHLQGVNKERSVWPPEPFAPIHLCSVVSPIAAHAVVMLANGDVLDPAKPGTHRLTDYKATHFVLGLYLNGKYEVRDLSI